MQSNSPIPAIHAGLSTQPIRRRRRVPSYSVDVRRPDNYAPNHLGDLNAWDGHAGRRPAWPLQQGE